jgi:prepilin-type N-terminal cleavage/methylation domain-containing protein
LTIRFQASEQKEVLVKHSRLGLTLVEVLIAVTVLAVGLLAVTGSSAMVTRMIGRGKVETEAALHAARRMELLRAAAASTTPRCLATGFKSGGPVLSGTLTESWSVSPTGPLRQVRVTVGYLTVHGVRSAVLETAIAC